MIRNNDYSRMLVGVGKMLTVRYNLPDETEQGYTQMQGTGFFVADGKGGHKEPTYTFGVTEKPYGIVMAKCSFAQGMVHRVYGKVSPVTEKVHITGPCGYIEYSHRPGDLLANEWKDAPVTVDGQGNWSVDVDWLVGGPKTIYAFCRRDPTAMALATCTLTIEGFDYEPDTEVMAELDSGVKMLGLLPVTVANTTDVELGGLELEVRVTGTAPEDAGTVYMWNYGVPTLSAYAGTINGTVALNTPVELRCSYYNPASSIGPDRLKPGRNYRMEWRKDQGYRNIDRVAYGTNDSLLVGDQDTDGFTLTVNSDFSATLQVTDGEKFKSTTGYEWTSSGMSGVRFCLYLLCEADKDWNAYWQQYRSETQDPENMCPICHGKGCDTCCHTGLELDSGFYKRHFTSYDFIAGYGAVRNGRFEIKTSGARLQMGSWQVLMFISEESRDATAQLEIIDSYPPCLSGDTPITMADGSTRPLRELHFGDQVLSGSGEATAVISTSRGRINPYHTLYTFEDGTVIDESADHRFYNVDLGYWAWLRDWRIGDRARRVDGSTTALVAVERVDEPAECYGLWTESRDYWAGGLLSGETMANQRLLAEATAEQAAEMLASIEPEMLREMMGG